MAWELSGKPSTVKATAKLAREYADMEAAHVDRPREFYVKCIHGWNAWRAGESTNLQYFVDAKVPSVK